jgi:small subunit ribosomal protein S14
LIDKKKELNIIIKKFLKKVINFSVFNMAKKGMIEREKKRQRLVLKYSEKRNKLKQEFKQTEFLEKKIEISRKLQKFPRNSSVTRLHNRCIITGRPKGYLRDFALSRHCLREMAHQGLLPGVKKASW